MSAPAETTMTRTAPRCRYPSVFIAEPPGGRETPRRWQCQRSTWARRSRSDFFESLGALTTRGIINRIVSTTLLFLCREQFPAAIGPKLQTTDQMRRLLLGKASHLKPVDDKWRMIFPLSPNHPAQVFKKREP